MNISDLIGIAVSIIAVVISVLSLKQTQRSIEQANRPYIVVYRDYIQVLSTVQEYIIIKNFGKTGAVIDSLEFSPNYKNWRGNDTYENISNTFIAPGQSISTVTYLDAFGKRNEDEERNGRTRVTISYHNGKNKYQETSIFNEELSKDIAFAKTNPTKSDTIEKVISKVTQELLRRGL
ncbi:hypothetical protein [Salinibacillus xinjiangensis]|uniref:Uncharacterized protein n=1 Tax=Salinibacillus xinjiangensis TaxID=1229268 RepID=A0A6G1X6W9_9BACI|nr:hypothetical protein [Salinibacillus xinjiangensis]MRG86714.1 hypothetical protein [Salinibacillus xinjiangensis]